MWHILCYEFYAVISSSQLLCEVGRYYYYVFIDDKIEE